MSNGFTAADMTTARANGYRDASEGAAPGVDLGKFRDLIGFAAWCAVGLPETDPRRDFIRQSNDLLQLIAPSPAAPGIDIEQFREAVEGRYSLMLNAYEAGHHSANTIEWHEAERDRLLALIDASPKGGSDAESRFAFCAKHEAFPVLTEDRRHWIMFVATDPAYPNIRAAHVAATPEAAIDAAMQATSAEVGS